VSCGCGHALLAASSKGAVLLLSSAVDMSSGKCLHMLRGKSCARYAGLQGALPHTLKPHCVSRILPPATSITSKWKPCKAGTWAR
jgi:hypothetical protein